ncbi:ABC-type spermidine/putrescine transport systems, ATPase components [Serratia grimesii]|nr:ABC-type spermidine/putrescine transport systems, ATPase components [Serratia grimesii]
MYGAPSTLFTAEFMGSNNRLNGKVTEVVDGKARIEGKDWTLWGMAGAGVKTGEDATAVIRVERVRLGDDPQGNQLELPLLTSMYLGDRWEYLFRTVAEDFVVRAYGTEVRGQTLCRLSLPPEHLWIFPKA